MKVSGFTYIRNGFKYQYPIIQAIQSILPICDEVIVAVGNSDDGTREAIEKLDSKIKIIDTVWDDELRKDGKIFATQSNIALKACTGDWLFHIQADEVIHENDLNEIEQQMKLNLMNDECEGLLFQFLNFYGSYQYLNDSRKQHRKEIRVFKNHKNIFSYKDSQGFRKFSSWENYEMGESGEKLKVKELKASVFHYNYVRQPDKMMEKAKYFDRFWHTDKTIESRYKNQEENSFYNIERVKKFTATHPVYMKKIVEDVNWNFDATKIVGITSIKNKLIYLIEDLIIYRIGEYKNYRKI